MIEQRKVDADAGGDTSQKTGSGASSVIGTKTPTSLSDLSALLSARTRSRNPASRLGSQSDNRSNSPPPPPFSGISRFNRTESPKPPEASSSFNPPPGSRHFTQQQPFFISDLGTRDVPFHNSGQNNQIRDARGGGQIRRRARPKTADEVIQATDHDAADARISAIRNGYLDDPFAGVLAGMAADDGIERAKKGEQQQRLPITNRGTYVRIKAVDTLVSRFLYANSNHPNRTRQVISLGAGSDSRYFRFVAENPDLDVVYHEIDFESNTTIKAEAIGRYPGVRNVVREHLQRAGTPNVLVPTKDLTQSTATEAAESTSVTETSNPSEDVEGSPSNEDSDATPTRASSTDDLKAHKMATDIDNQILFSPTQVISPRYNLHALDLRKLISGTDTPKLPNILPDAPTIILSECCLCYLSPAESTAILQAITTKLLSPNTPAALVLYEAILPSDPFGQQMTVNLESRGISFRTIGKYPNLTSQRERLVGEGFNSLQHASDVLFLWDEWIDEEDQERIRGLEMVDELEEWQLLAQHYCVAWAAREGGSTDLFSSAWGDLSAQVGDRKSHPTGGIRS